MPEQPSKALWTPVKEGGHLTDRIVARIESLMTEESLRPGQRLPPEREMAQLLGVSRPALREAVKTLEARGQLVVRHGQGVFVGQRPEDAVQARLADLKVSLEELFAMREVLEGPAAAWAAAAITPAKRDLLERALAAEQSARRPPIDLGRLATLDAAFHLRIVEVAENRFLHRTLGVLHEMLAAGMETTLHIPGRLEASARDHQAIFQAIADGDADAARVAAERHIHGARDAARAQIHDADAARTWEPARG
jgi:GntR family transcriptional regulator, transcriptional repressor for pyruvate dehydrogenase complex